MSWLSNPFPTTPLVLGLKITIGVLIFVSLKVEHSRGHPANQQGSPTQWLKDLP
ncbi:hypothetical protein SERLA73DRAFT_73960 [Serpula lacrymans var. lacrymans S7.3]|uniref:Uncharacterized protein n=1 Tax=Serpula lacrymans var. lacrymans (strain S7.3) TaxID=936435 RepID=F8PX59_SERL3|nr:hypothetical protein SERLA73DRAFT_73960 [Serpula lacrymans var. lacrymans S7.3]